MCPEGVWGPNLCNHSETDVWGLRPRTSVSFFLRKLDPQTLRTHFLRSFSVCYYSRCTWGWTNGVNNLKLSIVFPLLPPAPQQKGSQRGHEIRPCEDSAELKGPRQLLRIRPGIVYCRPKSAPKPDETQPKMPGAVPRNRHTPIPVDFGPVSWCFNTFQNFQTAS